MRFYTKKLAAAVLAAVTALTAAPTYHGQLATVVQAEEINADVTEAATLLEGLKGTYQQLFTDGIFKEQYNHYWHDFTAAVVGEGNADTYVSMLKASIGSDKYGAGADPHAFCCDYINGVKYVTFDGNQFTITLNDGSTVTHTYKFVRKDSLGGMMSGYIFESTDGNEDEFKYFFLCGDTPATTYHAEFRYGSNIDDLLKVSEGPYANWLVGAIQTSAFEEQNEATIQHVTALFCVENLLEYTNDETAKQRQPLVGTWDADLTAFRSIPEYANASLYCVLNADGTGSTYVDMAGTGEFINSDNYTFFAYNNDGNSQTDSGVYLPMNEKEEPSVSAGAYSITEKDGKKILTFTTPEGEIISYIKREETKDTGKADDSTTNKSTEDSTASNTSANQNADKSNTVTDFTSGNLKYKVTTTGKVQFSGVVKSKATVTIPASVKDSSGNSYQVTAIAKNALKNNKKVKKLTIGKNVTTIGAGAFNGCKKLKNITIKGSSLKKDW